MPKAFALIVDEIEQELQDTGNAFWTAAEIGIQLEDALREVAEYDKNELAIIYEFETRTGFDTAGTASKLTDTTETQFRSSDVDKVIFNRTERTFAIVTAFDSTSVLSLSKDIMNDTDAYTMYNRDCWNARQIYIGDIEDYIGDDHGVLRVEFKIDEQPRQYRNFTVEGNVLTVDYDLTIADSKSDDLASRTVEVRVFFAVRHQVSQLTDLAGAAAGAESAGATTMDWDGLANSEVIAEDQEFTIASVRGTYRVTAGVTLSGSGATTGNGLAFFPPVESAIADDAVITLKDSTLSRSLERIVVELAAARCAKSKAARLLREANTALTATTAANTALDKVDALITNANTEILLINTEIDLAKTAVAAGKTAADLAPAVILEANTEIDKMSQVVDAARASLDEASGSVNQVNVGGPNVPGQHSTVAAQRLAAVRGFLDVAGGYLSQSGSEGPLAQTFAALADANVTTGQGYFESARAFLEQARADVNAALGYLEEAASDLSVVDRARDFSAWGREKEERALNQLQRGLMPNQIRLYSKV